MKNKLNILLILLLPLFFLCSSDSSQLKYNGRVYRGGDVIIIQGMIVTIGSEPFLQNVLIDDDDNRFILLAEDNAAKLTVFPPGKVIVTGKLVIKKLELADKSKTTFVNYINPVKIEPVQ